MLAALNAPGRRGLAANLAVWLGLVVVLNGVIFALGWNTRSNSPVPWFAPPGWVIGLVWVGLFTLLATARWRLHARPGSRAWVTGLLLACLAFPFYAQAPGSVWAGFAGSVGTGLLAAVVATRAGPAAGLVLPTALWCAFASVLTGTQVGLLPPYGSTTAPP